MTNKIAIMGAGYVGLSTAVLLSQRYLIDVFDIDNEKVNMLKSGICPLKDQLLDEHFQKFRTNIRFMHIDSLDREVSYDFVFIALPTNFNEQQERFDTEKIDEILSMLEARKCTATIVIKSTVPIGYTEKLSKFVSFPTIFCPEFLREGHALHDNLYPSRIVVGGPLEQSERVAKLLLESARNNPQVFLTSLSEAETIKLASNSYLALRIAFFNELDTFSMTANMDANRIITAISADPRIGHGYNNPSFAFGGYCLPKDIKQFASSVKLHGANLELIQKVEQSNLERMRVFVELALKHDGLIGVYRLQMKAGSDNLRASANLRLAEALYAENKEFVVFEPDISVPAFIRDKCIKSFDEFKEKSTLIFANRWNGDLDELAHIVICRDIYNEN